MTLGPLLQQCRETATELTNPLNASAPCVALLGATGMGKTEVLRYAQKQLPDSVRGAYLSFKQFNGENSALDFSLVTSPFYEALFVALQIEASLSPSLDSLKQLLQQDMIITRLFLDDVQVLGDLPWGKVLYRELAALCDGEFNVEFVLSGTHQLKAWSEGLKNRRGLWRYVQQPPVELEPLSRLQLEAAFSQKDLRDSIYRLCGGHPYLLNLLEKHLPPAEAAGHPWGEALRRLRQDAGVWQELFEEYWGELGLRERRICFLLALAEVGLSESEIKTRLPGGGETSFGEEVAALTHRGLLIEEGGRWQLIGLFYEWYANISGLVLLPLAGPAVPPPAPATSVPTTEMIFLVDKELVLVKQGRVLSTSALSSNSYRIENDFPDDTNRLPPEDLRAAGAATEFYAKMSRLGRNLWDSFRSDEWFSALQTAVDQEHHCIFNLPLTLLEFPFELLPLDESGTRPVGAAIPISRRLFGLGQGQAVKRAPLAPPEEGASIALLVVAAVLDSEKRVAGDGRYLSRFEADIDEKTVLHLRPLRLEQEVAFLQQLGPQVQVTLLDRSVTESRLREALQEKQFDALHYVGHGVFTSSITGLALADRVLPLNALQELLERQEGLRFVYLSGCESGRATGAYLRTNRLGLAQTCVEAGVPAVLSMRWPIPMGVSHRLTQAFYDAFLGGSPIPQATFQAKRALARDADPLLSLYSHAPVLLYY